MWKFVDRLEIEQVEFNKISNAFGVFFMALGCVLGLAFVIKIMFWLFL